MEAIQWAIGILVVIQIPITGFIATRLWTHVVECRGVGEKVAAIDRDVERMKEDIGTTERGMRGTIHRLESTATQHELRIGALERK